MYKREENAAVLEKELNGILNGIPDIIKVYNPDYTIAFFNEAGYNFYNRSLMDIKGKMCYEVLNRKEKCLDCPFEQVVENKQMLSRERYIPELNTFMDVCYNPVLDDDGNILFIVERLRDITEKKFLDKILKDSKEKYKQILNNSPDAILIIVDNKIVLVNYEACNLLKSEYSKIIDSNVYKHFPNKYKKVLHKRFRNVIAQKRVKDIDDYEFEFGNNKKTNLEVSFTYIVYDGSPAILAILRDITEMKQELTSAAKLQRNTLQSNFPCEEHVNTVSVYTPAHMISGDSYRIQKINEASILGIVIDVRGKGISAALNISALDVLFLQEISTSHEPIDIVKSLNAKLVSYYEENYIAVCCFSMDFIKKELKVVGAGINRFIFQKKGQKVEEKIVRGPFLGMFEDSDFSEEIISFDSGDKVFFVSDGLDFIFDEDKIIQRYMGKVSVSQFKAYIDEFLDDTRLEVGKLDDDSTMLAMEIK
ncbi:SpoIIE family protein phosphatase [Clostridium sp. C2-6-12]|uniref:SpoIIE family protein phosphatase n=1 Tax=Clostridium sp. C2-6-12 TaxID=2698832 RepID=UPI00136A81CA|nr:SpoIIE family protein phosphatase [Clostridium sp. C2-6-12]